ncbi:protein FAM43A [Amblyraja radiata]|uniref:protein FAM43A n=1 Tax=Amblyraja radiata TaxID=386614 RepID=UPI00140254B2|nr:protein FAM43A [Amblyraja radiata]
MLPWRRGKAELLQRLRAKRRGYPGSECGGRGEGGGLAALDSAVGRVCGALRWRRGKASITADAPSHSVLYLGHAATLQSRGEGCADAAVARIWSRSEQGRSGSRMRMSISGQGLRLVAEARGQVRRPGHLYLLHRLTYCAAGPRCPRLFCWIYRHEVKHKAVALRCHAALMSRADAARAMALLLYQTSTTALADFQRLKRRDDARRQRHQPAPPAPLRQLLNRQCSYRPPAERSRSAPRLRAISEDAAGEERERGAGEGDGDSGLEPLMAGLSIGHHSPRLRGVARPPATGGEVGQRDAG